MTTPDPNMPPLGVLIILGMLAYSVIGFFLALCYDIDMDELLGWVVFWPLLLAIKAVISLWRIVKRMDKEGI